jgi:hypothetical protein
MKGCNYLSSLHRQNPDYLFWVGTAAVLLGAAALRFHHLSYESLGMDELHQVGYYGLSLRGVVVGAAKQTQPPLDYLIGWVLDKIGLAGSDWWVRFPALLFGIGSVAVLMWWVRRFSGNIAALVAGFLLAVSPLHVEMSQEARPYTIFLFCALRSLILYGRARVRNDVRSWGTFGLVFFLLLITRWVGPVVIGTCLAVYAFVAWVVAETSGTDREKEVERTRLWATATATGLPFAFYGPLFGVIYALNTRFASMYLLSLSGIFERSSQMVTNSFKAGFPNFPWIPLVLMILGLAVAVVRIFGWKSTILGGGEEVGSRGVNEPVSDLRVFFCLLGGFPFVYAIIYAFLSTVSPRPPYLLLIFPFVSTCVGMAIDELHNLLSKRLHAGAVTLGVVLTLATALPMLFGGKDTTWNRLSTQVKRDWRAAGQIARRHGDTNSALFLGVANSSPYLDWSPPFYGRERYVGEEGISCSIRQIAEGIGKEGLKAGTLYVAVYKDFRLPEFKPPDERRVPEGIEFYDLNGLALYRVRGTPESAPQRLLKVLTFVGSAAKRQGGFIDLYHATSQLYASFGEKIEAQKAYLEALKQCRSEAERLSFLGNTNGIRRELDIVDDDVKS